MIKLLDCEVVEIAAVRAVLDETGFNAWFDNSKIKERVKKACMQSQQLRCCYCRKFKPTIYNNEWDLEHVLCEKWYPQFFATPGNLAVACKQCNIAKDDEDVLRPQPRPDPMTEDLPGASARYSIPHPWIDDWDQYLAHVNYQIYRSDTEKGLELIAVCKLNKIAVEKGGLDYESVVEAVRTNFFDTFGGAIDPTLPDSDVLAHVANITINNEVQQAQGYLAALNQALATLEKQAVKRKPEDIVVKLVKEAAKQAVAKALIPAADDEGQPALPRPLGTALVSTAGIIPGKKK